MTATHVELHTVRRLRDALAIAHRLTRTYSTLRTARLPVLRPLQWAAYPLVWFSFFTMVSYYAGQAVHHGVAVVIVGNPVTRPHRSPLWRGLAASLAILIAAMGLEVYLVAGGPVDHIVAAPLALCLVIGFGQMLAGTLTHLGHGSLHATEKKIASNRAVSGPILRGHTFGAWPQNSHQFSPLFDAVLAEARESGVSLLVDARDAGVAEIYVNRFSGTTPDPRHPLHIAWITS